MLLLFALSRVRPWRRVAGLLTALALLFVVANGAILASRGFGLEAQAALADGSGTPVSLPGDVTVLSWNTLGDAPGAERIAELAVEQNADIVSLPETTEITGVAIAEAMRTAGRPMWVHTIAFDLVSKARSTTLLISPDLGDYAVTNEAGSGPPGNTNVLPTVVAMPVGNSAGPTVVAVHAVSPIQYEMPNWRSDLDWLADQCTGSNVIMAGDFNATVDHFAGRAADDGADGVIPVSVLEAESMKANPPVLGRCQDAGLATGSGAVGTWPTDFPALLGTPIDHVLSTPNWTVQSFRVLSTADAAGSDHRPIVAVLSPTAAE
jgi:endonuclease/exonuclease/phosphatase (EEP) superfamily protein YafD